MAHDGPDPGDLLEQAPHPWAQTTLRDGAPPPSQPSGGPVRCPSCPAHRLLERFARYEVVTYEPLLYCASCYGFWALGDSLARGVADPGSDHPALRLAPLEPRCRECLGRLYDSFVCRKCGKALPPLPCPACSKPMDRAKRDGIVLDICGACHGAWFEPGELPELYDLHGGPATLAQRYMAASGLDDEADESVEFNVATLIALVLRFLAL